MSYHIILAEDDLAVRLFLVRALSRLQRQAIITAVENGAEALACFQQQGADLIISDHRMPIMSGLELVRAIRALSDVPVVLISADITVEVSALAAGITMFVLKPVSMDQLRKILDQVLP
ncbi:MAG: response regulator [Chloroflexales bacterium]|nr:response regulator [Chloroflexales bacterium]